MLAFPAFAQNPPPRASQTNRLSSDRVLVILDISSGMQKRSENMQRVIGQMFASGFDGQLRRGDTIGMWTFNNALYAGEFPLQRWSPQTVRQVTSVAAQFAQNQRYSKQANLDPVMAQLTNVIADSDRITVVLVSDGSVAPVGTPYDAQIAEAFKLNGDEQRRQTMPFVTILRAVKGEFVGFKVNTPPWPMEYPPFPPEPVVVPVARPEPTNPPSAKTESPKPVEPVAKSEPKSMNVVTNPPVPAITNPPLVIVTEPEPKPVEPVTNPAPAVITNPPSSATNVEVARTIPPPTNTTTPRALPTVLPVGKPARDWTFIFVVTGGVALCGLVLICLAIWRNSRQPARVSLITRSMNKEQK